MVCCVDCPTANLRTRPEDGNLILSKVNVRISLPLFLDSYFKTGFEWTHIHFIQWQLETNQTYPQVGWSLLLLLWQSIQIASERSSNRRNSPPMDDAWHGGWFPNSSSYGWQKGGGLLNWPFRTEQMLWKDYYMMYKNWTDDTFAWWYIKRRCSEYTWGFKIPYLRSPSHEKGGS